MALFDSAGININNLGDASVEDAQILSVDCKVSVSGTYYVRVSDETDGVYNWDDPAGKYELSVYDAWFNPGVSDSDRGYYGTYNTARYIQNGNYATKGLAHVYRFVVEKGVTVGVGVTAHLSVGGLDFGIYDKEGTELAGSNDTSITDGQTGTASKTIYALNQWVPGSSPGGCTKIEDGSLKIEN